MLGHFAPRSENGRNRGGEFFGGSVVKEIKVVKVVKVVKVGNVCMVCWVCKVIFRLFQ